MPRKQDELIEAVQAALLARAPAIAAWSPAEIKEFVQAVEVAYSIADHADKGGVGLKGTSI